MAEAAVQSDLTRILKQGSGHLSHMGACVHIRGRMCQVTPCLFSPTIQRPPNLQMNILPLARPHQCS